MRFLGIYLVFCSYVGYWLVLLYIGVPLCDSDGPIFGDIRVLIFGFKFMFWDGLILSWVGWDALIFKLPIKCILLSFSLLDTKLFDHYYIVYVYFVRFSLGLNMKTTCRCRYPYNMEYYVYVASSGLLICWILACTIIYRCTIVWLRWSHVWWHPCIDIWVQVYVLRWPYIVLSGLGCSHF